MNQIKKPAMLQHCRHASKPLLTTKPREVMNKNQFIALIHVAMKISIAPFILIVAFNYSVFAHHAGAQQVLDKTVSLSVEQADIKNIIGMLEQQTGAKFIYSSKSIQAERKISCHVENKKLSSFLSAIFYPLNISYKVVEDKIILYASANTFLTQFQEEVTVSVDGGIKGVVKGSSGEPLAGASVQIKNSKYATTTDSKGNFELNGIPEGKYVLIVSYVGYISKEISINVNDAMQTVSVSLSEDVLQLQQVIVTGTNPKKKIESSVAITTMSNRQMEVRAPLNTADMFKAIPGIWVESSGGDGPGNTAVRGLPSTNGYQFMTIMEDGLPVLPAGFGSLPSADQYAKVDATIKNVEAIRGGTAPILAFNSSGAVVNNISYTGGPRQYGKIKFTSGLTQDLYRIEANTGGKIDKADNWEYNVGGFYRTDEGIRPPSFTPNQGGQVKANITRKFKNNNYVRVYGKYLNDKTQFLEPGYYAYNTDKKAKALPGFDVFKESIVPSDTKFTVTLPEGESYSVDLADGYKTKSWYAGLLLHFNTSKNWIINNHFRYQGTKTRAIYTFVGGAIPYTATQTYFYLNGTQLQNPTGFYTAQSTTDAYVEDNQIIDYLDVSKKLGKHSLNLGTGIYIYKIPNSTSKGFVSYSEIKAQPKRLLINTNTGNGITPLYLLSPGGNVKYSGKTVVSSLYASDEFEISNQWRVDVGARFDHVHIDGERGSHTQTPNGYALTGEVPFSKDKIYWTVTAGANYKINETIATYARFTRTYNAINIGDLSSLTVDPNRLQNREVYMGELGAKYAGSRLSFFGSFVYTNASNMPFNHNIPTANGGSVSQSTFGSSRTYSFELEASYLLIKGLNVRLNTTFQNSKYTKYKFDITAQGVRPDLAGKSIDWSDNDVARIPKVMIQFSADYEYKWFNAFANFNEFGKRWSTAADTYELSAFNELNVGIGLKFIKQIELRGWVNNLLNSRGLTEGNTRGDQFLDPSTLVEGQYLIGRATLPQSFWVSVSYSF